MGGIIAVLRDGMAIRNARAGAAFAGRPWPSTAVLGQKGKAGKMGYYEKCDQ
jgi:hypothetical protein